MTAAEHAPAEHGHAHGEADSHPQHSDWLYIKIALILGVITAVETATYFKSALPIFENTAFVIVSLLIMASVKFGLVAAYFMHLKFDHPMLRRIFISGLGLAGLVYFVFLMAFEFFAD
ncbi:MAG: cytochrome C oxidase subunit IV family protein [Acidimicrobiales bacterium]